MNHNLFESRRNMLRKLAAAGVLGAGGIAGLVRDLLAAGSIPATPGMRQVKGTVMVDGTRATVGLIIKPGQTIITGAEGQAIYVIGADAYLQHENTTVIFGDTISIATAMRVITGKILSVFGKGPRKIATATATIGIRGTGCYIEAEEARTYFCLCYGEAEVTPTADAGQKETIRTSHHEHPIYINAKGDRMMAPATVINHTDAELTMLENLVGRWPPFYGQDYKPY